MNSTELLSEPLRQRLLAERELSIDDYWAHLASTLDRPLSAGLNLAHECSDRWARDRARIATVVHHSDGSSQRWTFADISRASSRMANVLKQAGLKPGDRFAALLNQQIEAYVCALAAWRSGIVYVPLFVGFGADAVAVRLNGADAAAIVVAHDSRDAFEKVRTQLDCDPMIFTVAGPEGRGLYRGDRSLWAEIDRQTPDFGLVETSADHPATLIYTSGTTGAPKGCLHPHSLLLPLQSFLRHVVAPRPSDMFFAGANPGWSYGLYATGLGLQSLGVPRVMYTGSFDAATWLRIFDEERVTYVATAPSAYRGLVAAAKRGGVRLQLRGGLSAGEPLDAGLTTAWAQVGGGVLQDGYGSSEMGMVLANLAFEDREIPAGALSSVVPGFDVGLVGHDGEPTSAMGTIAIRSPRWPILGYADRPELWTAKHRGEWFLSGDLARRDDEGLWWFVGRDDDLIVTAGYNVGPTEVENAILGQPGVSEVAVVAAPDADRGSVVRAVIVADGSVPHDEITSAIQKSVREKLGRHAYPKIIDFVDALPKTETGKVRRNALREGYVAER